MRKALIAAAACGSVSVLGWAPFDWWWIPLLGYGLLFHLLMNTRSAVHAGLLGLAFGLGLHLAGHGWIVNSLHHQTGVGWAWAVFSTVFFSCCIGMFTALPCWLWRWAMPMDTRTDARTDTTAGAVRGMPTLLALGALLTLGEWGRSLFLNGFTSLSLGYSLTDTWLRAYAPVLGLYGVSCAAYFTIGLLFAGRRAPIVALTLITTMVAIGYGLGRLEWVEPSGPPLSYRLLQPNVPQERKFDPTYASLQVAHLLETIEHQPADIILTPETAFAMFLAALPGDTLSRLQRFSDATRSHLFAGIPTTGGRGESHNSMIQIAPHQHGIAQYDKVRLMPFGEYSPAGFDWFVRSITVPLKDLTAGDASQQPFVLGAQRIGTLICQEDMTGQEARRWLPAATILLNPSNMAWVEDSVGLNQHLQIVQMRALESGRPVLRAPNTGITAHIDHRGAVRNRLREKEEGVLSGQVQPMQGVTPYVRWGDVPVVVGCGLLLLVSWLVDCMRQRGATKSA
jgi:apolipoprotein N-acyltransferase